MGHPWVQSRYFTVVIGQLLALILAIFGIAPRTMTVAVYVFTMNLDNQAAATLDGGNNLAHLIMFYMMFMNISGRPIRGTGIVAMLGRALSNAASFTAQIQVVIVYLCGSLYKVNGELWQNGMAIFYILQAETFTHPWLYYLIRRFPLLSLLGTYSTIAFQMSFPILVWFQRVRPFVLLSAIAFHLTIAFGMGLITFGLVMCVMTTLFFPETWSRRIIALFSKTNRTRVAASASNPRLNRLLIWLKLFDWRGSITIVEFERLGLHDGTSPSRLQPNLVIFEEYEGRSYSGAYALWRLCGKLPVSYVLFPFWCAFGIAYYFGLAQRLFCLWARPQAVP